MEYIVKCAQCSAPAGPESTLCGDCLDRAIDYQTQGARKEIQRLEGVASALKSSGKEREWLINNLIEEADEKDKQIEMLMNRCAKYKKSIAAVLDN